ncbi:MAG: prefoldin subunit alpha [archaeon]|nr:MAG: prefoldin subunit alpha [archaeon]
MKENLNQRIIEFQMFEMQLNELAQQKEIVEKQMTELRNLELSLDQVGEMKPQTEMFSIVGQDTFVRSELKDTKKVLVNVGSKIFVNKGLEEVKKSIENRLHKIEFIQQELNKKAEKILEKLRKIGEEIKACS